MIDTPPPAGAPQGVSAGGGSRRVPCPHCRAAVTKVDADHPDGAVLVDGRSTAGRWLAVRGPGGGWRLTRGPGPGVRYAEHGCMEMALAVLLEVATPVVERTRTSGPCARRCGRTVPNRYGPDAVTTCPQCRPAPR